jgi:hypothetical protein
VALSVGRTQFRVLSAALLPFVVGAAVNYYMDLGWFGRYGRLVLSVTILLTCILVALGRGRTQGAR